MPVPDSPFVEGLLFSIPAILIAGSIAVSAGVLGVFVLLKRHTLAALAVPQAVAVGVAVGMRLTWPHLLTADGPLGAHAALIPSAIAAALSILFLASTRSPAHVDALLGACYVGGWSLSFLLL